LLRNTGSDRSCRITKPNLKTILGEILANNITMLAYSLMEFGSEFIIY